MIRAVLFDATGTLIDLRESVGDVYSRAARDHGAIISAWRLDDAFRRVLAQAPPMVFPEAPPAERPALERAWWRQVVRATFLAADSSRRVADFEGCFAWLWARFSSAEAWQARAGARTLLERLEARGLKRAVVSNFDARLPAILRGLGLADLLDAVVLPAEAAAAKPHPAIFALALEKLGVAPAEAIFVGDDATRDLAGARDAGLAAVDVASLATLEALAIPGS
ncbi:MAG: HAD-IA family hydrolase [Myxococcota bacterium]|nr:HAD-IA family hydrolase [Myxococcota bacterium]